jgi:ketosteroid isomerase-like protein
MTQHINEFLSAWTAAEHAGDAEGLATLLTDDFYGVGPLGFVLPKPSWLGRHRQGLDYKAFGLDEIQIRFHGDMALVTARNNTVGTFQGQSLPEALRVTLVIATESRTPRIAAIHMSFIAGTQGAAPIPAASSTADGRDDSYAAKEGR